VTAVSSGWRWALICAGLAVAMAVSALAVGFRLPYWWHADQDLVIAYHGLLFNAGLPQEYFDHPGYPYFLIVAGWYRLLHGLGLLPVHTLPAMPSPADAAGFDAAFQHLVEAGRALGIVLAGVFVAVYATLVRRLVGDDRVAALAGLGLAFGVGLTTHVRQLRTELVSAALLTTALLLVLTAARGAYTSRRTPLALAGAGVAAALAVLTKVQAVFPALALPLLALPFGTRPPSSIPPLAGSSRRVLVWLVLATAAAVPAAVLIAGGIAQGLDAQGSGAQGVFTYRPVGAGLSGVYQGLFAVWVAMGMAVYARVWRVPAAEAAAAMAAVACGVGLGVLALLLRYDPRNVVVVANLVEHMFVFSSMRHHGGLDSQTQVLGGSLLALLAEGLWRTIAIRTVVLHPDHVPQTLIFEWFAMGCAALAWRRGQRQPAIQAGLLLATAWGLETLFSLRGFQRAYAVYTDPLVVLAAALMLRHFAGPILDRPAGRRRLAGAMALYVILAHVWPVIGQWRQHDAAEACVWTRAYIQRLATFPFCQPAGG
jgi:hypothetical protein